MKKVIAGNRGIQLNQKISTWFSQNQNEPKFGKVTALKYQRLDVHQCK